MPELHERLLEIADDELILGWRNSEWTGIAPFLEEDVAFSSVAQNEIGHARALYGLVASERELTADELALDRRPDEYRSAPLVELRLVPDWGRTIARHYLYETADAARIAALKEVDVPEVAGLAAKIEREEAYHLMHAEMWVDRLLATTDGRQRLRAGVDDLWPYALGVLEPELRGAWAERVRARLGWELPDLRPVGRDERSDALAELWEEMTMVRRSQPAGVAW
ncbi:MAG: phenylacetate-CoA oxygenase subunit PaaC [Thermoleophilia bacterium]|nr:phenylacetate-CoA oxygenase subunit PaaC [Thermoleophilia bacterium]